MSKYSLHGMRSIETKYFSVYVYSTYFVIISDSRSSSPFLRSGDRERSCKSPWVIALLMLLASVTDRERASFAQLEPLVYDLSDESARFLL